MLIHLPIEGHVGCFQFGAIMKIAAINTHVQVIWEYTFSTKLAQQVYNC